MFIGFNLVIIVLIIELFIYIQRKNHAQDASSGADPLQRFKGMSTSVKLM